MITLKNGLHASLRASRQFWPLAVLLTLLFLSSRTKIVINVVASEPNLKESVRHVSTLVNTGGEFGHGLFVSSDSRLVRVSDQIPMKNAYYSSN